jgi:peroxiredoxin
MKKQRLLLTSICIFLSLTFLLGAFEGSAAAAEVGDNAPLFNLKDLDGNDVYLSTFKGENIFLNFWASWCPYCKKERKELTALHKAYKDKDLVIISISLDRSEKKLRTFMKDNPAEYIVLTDTKMESAGMYGVRGFPTTFLIGRDGVIQYKSPGYREWSSSASRQIVDKLIK